MSFEDNEQTNSKNFIVAMILFMAIIFGYEYFDAKRSSSQQDAQKTEETEVMQEEKDTGAENSVSEFISISDAMKSSLRFFLENDHVKSSINLNGGIVDSVVLKDYKQTVEPGSENIMLLSPKNTEHQFYYSISYMDKSNQEKISDAMVWSLDKKNSENGRSAVLKARTKNGLVIERTITIDNGYLLSIKDKVTNRSNREIKLTSKSEMIKSNPEMHNYAVVHEGLVGAYDGKVDEIKYKDIGAFKALNNCNWLGYTDLYWLCAVINGDKKVAVSYSKTDDEYKITAKRKGVLSVAPGASIDLKYSIFAGPKDIKTLKDYRDKEGLDKFEMAIDFGWFFMITKPLLQLVDLLSDIFSNMGFVILILTLFFRVITYPLMKKSFVSAAKMKEIQPKIAMLQKTYSHDKMRMNQELMMLYKKEKISPMSGCLPMLLQAPIFFCLYKIFFISIEMRHAPLFGWIRDLSAPDHLYFSNFFGLIDWTPPSFLQIGVCPLVMGITMYLQQRLSTANKSNITEKTSEQKMQENMMLFMPVLFTYICASFPVAVVIYWTISNIFSMVQQYYVNKKIGRRA